MQKIRERLWVTSQSGSYIEVRGVYTYHNRNDQSQARGHPFLHRKRHVLPVADAAAVRG